MRPDTKTHGKKMKKNVKLYVKKHVKLYVKKNLERNRFGKNISQKKRKFSCSINRTVPPPLSRGVPCHWAQSRSGRQVSQRRRRSMPISPDSLHSEIIWIKKNPVFEKMVFQRRKNPLVRTQKKKKAGPFSPGKKIYVKERSCPEGNIACSFVVWIGPRACVFVG